MADKKLIVLMVRVRENYTVMNLFVGIFSTPELADTYALGHQKDGLTYYTIDDVEIDDLVEPAS